MDKSPDIAIHVMGEFHSASGIDHLPNIQQQARDFFFPGKGRQQKGRNVWIGESYGMSPEDRAAVVRNSKKYSPLEAFLRTAYRKVEDQMPPQEIDREVAMKKMDRYSPRWSEDYYTQERINQEAIYKTTNFQIDSEFHPADKVQQIEEAARRIEEASNKSAAALWFGETDLAVKKYNETLPPEAEFTRDRHAMMGDLVAAYADEAQSTGTDLRILVTFGGGHVKGLVRKFGEVFSGTDVNPKISSSHASGGFHSHRYDFMYELEAHPDLAPSRRATLNMALENVFLESPMNAGHPLRQSLNTAELAAMVYPRLKDSSDDEVVKVLKAIENGGFEQGLTQLTGVGELIETPNSLSRAVGRRISKFFALGR